jgi:hypothetical protein
VPLQARLSDLQSTLKAIVSHLRRYEYAGVAERIANDEARLVAGDLGALESVISETTGSMGSLRDVYLYPPDDAERVSANEELDRLVERADAQARAAMAAARLKI